MWGENMENLDNVQSIEIETIGKINRCMIKDIEITRELNSKYVDFKVTLKNKLCISGNTELTYFKLVQYRLEEVQL